MGVSYELWNWTKMPNDWSKYLNTKDKQGHRVGDSPWHNYLETHFTVEGQKFKSLYTKGMD
jgi:hypothetical protein